VADAKANVFGLPGRYATALFDLAKDGKAIDTVAASLATLRAALADSDVLRSLTANPLVSRTDAAKAIAGVAASLKLDGLTTKFLGTLAANRRLGALEGIIGAFTQLHNAHKGESTAEVVSAHALSADQVDSLKKKLRAGLGRDVAIDLKVDPAILGGLIVKVGSKLIDSSLKTKLDTLSLAMKG
jgi:F-type H+-transporting ATPase subunit delta